MKIKLLIIFGLGILSIYYNIKNSNAVECFKSIDYNTLIYSHIGVNTNDSYVGVLLDVLIFVFFFINVKDINTFFKIFGG